MFLANSSHPLPTSSAQLQNTGGQMCVSGPLIHRRSIPRHQQLPGGSHSTVLRNSLCDCAVHAGVLWQNYQDLFILPQDFTDWRLLLATSTPHDFFIITKSARVAVSLQRSVFTAPLLAHTKGSTLPLWAIISEIRDTWAQAGRWQSSPSDNPNGYWVTNGCVQSR